MLGAEAVSFWAGVPRPGLERALAAAWLREGVSRVLEHAERRGVVAALEPEPGMLVETLDDWIALARDLPALTLALDLGHCLVTGEREPPAAVREFAANLGTVAIEDMRRGDHTHLPFGEGDMDIPACLDALEAVGFPGLVCVELSRESHRADTHGAPLPRLAAGVPRMRVLFCSRRFFPAISGMSVYAQNLLRHLVAAGHDVTMVSQYRGDPAGTRVYGGGPPPPVPGVKVIGRRSLGEERFAEPGGADFERDVDDMLSTILAEHREKPFDILHAQYGYPNGWAVLLAARELGIPAVVSIQGGDGHWVGSCCETHREAMLRVLNHADALLIGCESFAGRRWWTASASPASASPSSPAPWTWRASAPRPAGSAGAAADPVRLLYHGRVDRRKGALDFLEALALLRDEGGLRFDATISGIGPDYDASRETADRLGLAVRFTGYADYDAAPAVYHGGDVFVSPTYAEGFSNTILEAMASGLPGRVLPRGRRDGLPAPRRERPHGGARRRARPRRRPAPHRSPTPRSAGAWPKPRWKSAAASTPGKPSPRASWASTHSSAAPSPTRGFDPVLPHDPSCRFRAAPAPALARRRMPLALALSPHLDDAAFSCGGTLAALAAEGWEVAVATLFTASVEAPTGFALACQTDKGLPAGGRLHGHPPRGGRRSLPPPRSAAGLASLPRGAAPRLRLRRGAVRPAALGRRRRTSTSPPRWNRCWPPARPTCCSRPRPSAATSTTCRRCAPCTCCAPRRPCCGGRTSPISRAERRTRPAPSSAPWRPLPEEARPDPHRSQAPRLRRLRDPARLPVRRPGRPGARARRSGTAGAVPPRRNGRRRRMTILSDPAAVEARRAGLAAPHMRPLAAFAASLRERTGQRRAGRRPGRWRRPRALPAAPGNARPRHHPHRLRVLRQPDADRRQPPPLPPRRRSRARHSAGLERRALRDPRARRQEPRAARRRGPRRPRAAARPPCAAAGAPRVRARRARRGRSRAGPPRRAPEPAAARDAASQPHLRLHQPRSAPPHRGGAPDRRRRRATTAARPERAA